MIEGYKFTNRKQSTYGIMSTVFGLLSTITWILCIVVSYKAAGQDVHRLGASALLAVIFMLVSLVLDVMSWIENDKFNLFKITGAVFFLVSLAFLSAMMYAGAML